MVTWLHKLQQLPEFYRKAILWAAVILIAIFLLWWQFSVWAKQATQPATTPFQDLRAQDLQRRIQEYSQMIEPSREELEKARKELEQLLKEAETDDAKFKMQNTK